jgi:hypothetical protein
VALVGAAALGALVWLDLVDHQRWARAGMAETRRRAQELRLALTENLPVYRGQLTLTTCDVRGAGTDNAVQVKLNAGNGTWLDYSHDDFERGSTFTYDVALDHVADLRDISMLEISKRGFDAWCLRRVELHVNNGLIFEAHYPGAGRWLGHTPIDRRTLTLSREDLRRNRAWAAYRPSVPPRRIAREEITSRLESAVGHALHGQRATWRQVTGRGIQLERTGHFTYAGMLNLKAKLDNWPDPSIDLAFTLAVSCVSGELRMRVRDLTFAVDSPWYSDLATFGIGDVLIRRVLQRTFGDFTVTRRTMILICPPELGIAQNGDLRLY